jgi:hypothetical protein
MRNDEKPFRVESVAQEVSVWASRSYQRVMVATVYQHGRMTRAVPENGISQKKDAERRDKLSDRTGKGTRYRQNP